MLLKILSADNSLVNLFVYLTTIEATFDKTDKSAIVKLLPAMNVFVSKNPSRTFKVANISSLAD